MNSKTQGLAEAIGIGNIGSLTEADRQAIRIAGRRIKQQKLSKGIVARVEPGQYAPELNGCDNLLNPRFKRRTNLALQFRRGRRSGVRASNKVDAIIHLTLVEQRYDLAGLAPENWPPEWRAFVAELAAALVPTLAAEDVLPAALFVAEDLCGLLPKATQGSEPARVGSWRFLRTDEAAASPSGFAMMNDIKDDLPSLEDEAAEIVS